MSRGGPCPALVPSGSSCLWVRQASGLNCKGVVWTAGVPGQAPSGALLMVLALPPRYLWTVLHSISPSALSPVYWLRFVVLGVSRCKLVRMAAFLGLRRLPPVVGHQAE